MKKKRYVTFDHQEMMKRKFHSDNFQSMAARDGLPYCVPIAIDRDGKKMKFGRME